MMKVATRKSLWLFALTMACPSAVACSIQGSTLFLPNSSPIINETIAAPRLWLESIKRGYSDGNPGSCSDAGIITLRVDRSDHGYRIKVADGNIDRHTFPDSFMTPNTREPGILRFAWLDDPRLPGADIQSTIEIVAMDRFGRQSEPFLVSITQSDENQKPSGLPLPNLSIPDY